MLKFKIIYRNYNLETIKSEPREEEEEEQLSILDQVES